MKAATKRKIAECIDSYTGPVVMILALTAIAAGLIYEERWTALCLYIGFLLTCGLFAGLYQLSERWRNVTDDDRE